MATVTTYRVEVRQANYVYGFIDIEEDEDWDGRLVANEFDARDLAYDLATDGSDRIVWNASKTDEIEIMTDVEII